MSVCRKRTPFFQFPLIVRFRGKGKYLVVPGTAGVPHLPEAQAVGCRGSDVQLYSHEGTSQPRDDAPTSYWHCSARALPRWVSRPSWMSFGKYGGALGRSLGGLGLLLGAFGSILVCSSVNLDRPYCSSVLFEHVCRGFWHLRIMCLCRTR